VNRKGICGVSDDCIQSTWALGILTDPAPRVRIGAEEAF
jgi:hypothetical protein